MDQSTKPTIGSYWQDAFPLGCGRVVKVMGVDDTHVTIMTLVNSDQLQLAWDNRGNFGGLRDMRGTTRQVRITRFRDTVNGFVFVPDGPAEVARRDREQARTRQEMDDLVRSSLGTADEAATGFAGIPADETFRL